MEFDAAAVSPLAARRRIAVPGTANFREIGGHAVGGAVLATGRLFRADGLADLGDRGREALRKLGVATVIDLREPIEVEQHPGDTGEGIEVLPIPVFEELEIDWAVTDLAGLYIRIVDDRGQRLAAAVSALVAVGDRPAVVHCSAGKDRTGIVVALVLSALGVAGDDIADDYALTAELLRGAPADRIRRRAAETGMTEQIIAVAMDSPREAMVGLLAHVDEVHGGAAAYLVAHGVTPDELTSLRVRMGAPLAA